MITHALNRDGRCKKLVASFGAEYEASLPRLERAVEEEPTRLLTNCDDVRRLCRVRPSRNLPSYKLAAIHEIAIAVRVALWYEEAAQRQHGTLICLRFDETCLAEVSIA